MNNPRKTIADAFKEVRQDFLGFPHAEQALKAQSTLSIDAYRAREQGRYGFTLDEFIGVCQDWGASPAEVFCRMMQSCDGSTYGDLALKLGISSGEVKQRFEARMKATGMKFGQLYLLVMNEQVRL